MKKNIFFLCLLSANILNAISQEDADAKLIQSVEELNVKGIVRSLCEGANKNTSYYGLQMGELLKDHLNSEAFKRDLSHRYKAIKCDETFRFLPDLLISCLKNINTFPKPDLNFIRQNGHHWERLGRINGTDYHHDTVIHRLIKCGEQADCIVRDLIGKRSWFKSTPKGINAQNDDGDTPLYLVMKTERSDESRRRMCLLLVSRGANAAIVNKVELCPLTTGAFFWKNLFSSGPLKEEGILGKLRRFFK